MLLGHLELSLVQGFIVSYSLVVADLLSTGGATLFEDLLVASEVD